MSEGKDYRGVVSPCCFLYIYDRIPPISMF